MGTFQYVVLYNSTRPTRVIGWYDYGAPPFTITNGNSFTVDFDQVNGVLTIT